MPISAITKGGSTKRQLKPAKKMTEIPVPNTSRDVPKSGCFMIKPTGTINNRPATIKSSGRN